MYRKKKFIEKIIKIFFLIFCMANNYKEINWNEVRAAIIWKPETWKVETLCTFLKLCNFNSIVGKFS